MLASMTVAVGSTMGDCSGMRPTVAQLKANHIVGIFRYLSPPRSVAPSAQWKVITKSEFDRLIAGGIEVVLNYEWYSTRALEGAAAGKQDGQWAYAAARALGYAKGATIYVSNDTDTYTQTQFLKLAAYLRAFQAAQGGYYVTLAPYGGIKAVEAMHGMGLAKRIWQAVAWSGNKVSKWANVYQNGKKLFNGQMDVDQVRILPVGGHTESLPKPPAPKPPAKPKPKLQYPWPKFMGRLDYFGLESGGAHSRGGFNAEERPAIAMIQHRLNELGFSCHGDATGYFHARTHAALTAWQEKYHKSQTSLPGQCWKQDWTWLFTY